MRFKTILSILCLLGFAAMAQAAPSGDASAPAAPGDRTPGDPSEAVAPDASPDKPGTRGPAGEGDRRPPGWTLINIAFLNGDSAGQAGPDTPGTRGASEDAEFLRLAPGEMSSLVNGNAGSGIAGAPENWHTCIITGLGCPPGDVHAPSLPKPPGTRGASDSDGQAGPDTPGTRGASEDAEPLRLTSEQMSSLVNGTAGEPVNWQRCFALGWECPPGDVHYEAPPHPSSKPLSNPGSRGASPDAADGAHGQTAGKPAAASPDSDAAARIALGLRLVALGREARSPYTLAAAAELLASAGTEDSETGKVGIEGDPAPAGSVPTD
ncbi:MAG: hypothetical protein LBQ79_04845, partial [Deltaproteobacteria bacterium]|nr:hypothetical protein [Deltaproteobacteria bacterium]